MKRSSHSTILALLLVMTFVGLSLVVSKRLSDWHKQEEGNDMEYAVKRQVEEEFLILKE